MTELELKILANAKPRIEQYEKMFLKRPVDKEFRAGTVIFPIASYNGVIDRLIYDTKKKRFVAIAYFIEVDEDTVEYRRIDLTQIDLSEIEGDELLEVLPE